MSKPLVLFAIVSSFASAPAFAQATSGGQTPQPGGMMGSSEAGSYNSSNATEQYVHQRQIGNLPEQQNARANGGKSERARPAKADELTAGAMVNDRSGAAIAKIEQVDADGVVVSTGLAKIKVPKEAFGHNKAGLLLDMTKAQFEQVVAQANTVH
jgi:hypothetical protein